MHGLRSRALMITVALALAAATWGCGAAKPAADPAGPPVWDRTALHPGAAHMYGIQLVDGDSTFGGWIEIRLGSQGDRSTISWELGGEEGADFGPTPDGLHGLLQLGDAFIQSLLRSTLLSPVLDHPITLYDGWRGSFQSDGHTVNVTAGEMTGVGPFSGYLVTWRVEGHGLALDLEAVIDPGRALPLLVVVAETSPGDYVLEVRLERID